MPSRLSIITPFHGVRIRARSENFGREVGVYTVCHVVCRPTRREAEDVVSHYTANADWAVIDTMVAMLGRKPETEAELAARPEARNLL